MLHQWLYVNCKDIFDLGWAIWWKTMCNSHDGHLRHYVCDVAVIFLWYPWSHSAIIFVAVMIVYMTFSFSTWFMFLYLGPWFVVSSLTLAIWPWTSVMCFSVCSFHRLFPVSLICWCSFCLKVMYYLLIQFLFEGHVQIYYVLNLINCLDLLLQWYFCCKLFYIFILPCCVHVYICMFLGHNEESIFANVSLRLEGRWLLCPFHSECPTPSNQENLPFWQQFWLSASLFPWSEMITFFCDWRG